MATEPQTKPNDFSLSKSSMLLLFKSNINYYYYYSARKLILVLMTHGQLNTVST